MNGTETCGLHADCKRELQATAEQVVVLPPCQGQTDRLRPKACDLLGLGSPTVGLLEHALSSSQRHIAPTWQPCANSWTTEAGVLEAF
eukprot:2217148-Amphidinium_carterae.1